MVIVVDDNDVDWEMSFNVWKCNFKKIYGNINS